MYAIAIDGPAASGKSSVAKRVAKRLNVLHLNTGSLYRAIGLYAYKNKLASNLDENGKAIVTPEEISKILNGADVSVKYIDGQQHTFLNGDDVTTLLKTPVVSDYASRVAPVPEIREHVLAIQRGIAEEHNVVMEGRDITSHVLPNAKYKFFMTASPEVRAERCLNELLEKGLMSTYQEVLQDIKERDSRDMHREISPLVIVPDAIIVDTTNLSVDETVDYILGFIKE